MPCPVIAYDANGNTLTDAQGRSFTWDFENRLTQVVNPGVGTTTFRYDPFGRRIQKSGPLGTTNYLYDGNGENVIEEVDSNGNVLARYTERVLDEPFAELRSGTTSYYQQDAVDAAERREHELQLRFVVASAVGATSGGNEHAGRRQLLT